MYFQRILFLETIAGVPGMVAATLRHLTSLRLMVSHLSRNIHFPSRLERTFTSQRRDSGWLVFILFYSIFSRHGTNSNPFLPSLPPSPPFLCARPLLPSQGFTHSSLKLKVRPPQSYTLYVLILFEST